MKKIIIDNDYDLNNIMDTNNIEIIKINSIEELNIEDPTILFISNINNKNEYKILIKYLKKLKNKVLIINDNNKYLRKIFLRNLDIYRYGNNIYDDIEYIKKEDKIILKYDSKKYILNTLNEKILGFIIIGLLFGIEIEEILKNIEKNY